MKPRIKGPTPRESRRDISLPKYAKIINKTGYIVHVSHLDAYQMFNQDENIVFSTQLVKIIDEDSCHDSTSEDKCKTRRITLDVLLQ